METRSRELANKMTNERIPQPQTPPEYVAVHRREQQERWSRAPPTVEEVRRLGMTTSTEVLLQQFANFLGAVRQFNNPEPVSTRCIMLPY